MNPVPGGFTTLEAPSQSLAELRSGVAHLDSCQFLPTFTPGRRGSSAPSTGCVRFACPGPSRCRGFTILFERLAVDVLKECDVLGAGRLLRTSWDETWHLMERAVARGQAVKPVAVPALMGVDEKAAGRGHDYITVVSDLGPGTVEYISDERRESSLDGYFDQFSTEQLAGIEAVA